MLHKLHVRPHTFPVLRFSLPMTRIIFVSTFIHLHVCHTQSGLIIILV